MPTTFNEWMWWVFSVVLVSYVINITSSYFKTLIEKRLDGFSQSRQLKSKKERQEVETQAKLLTESALYNSRFEIRVGTIQVLQYIILGVVLIIAVQLIIFLEILNPSFIIKIGGFISLALIVLVPAIAFLSLIPILRKNTIIQKEYARLLPQKQEQLRQEMEEIKQRISVLRQRHEEITQQDIEFTSHEEATKYLESKMEEMEEIKNELAFLEKIIKDKTEQIYRAVG